MGKVLIAEDDVTCRKILHHTVEDMGHTAICSPNGRHAWETLQVNRDVRMVITDVQMPKMDGRELIRTLRADPELGCLPVLIISGVIGPKAIADLLARGATLFLPKPLNVGEISKYVARCMEEPGLRA